MFFLSFLLGPFLLSSFQNGWRTKGNDVAQCCEFWLFDIAFRIRLSVQDPSNRGFQTAANWRDQRKDEPSTSVVGPSMGSKIGQPVLRRWVSPWLGLDNLAYTFGLLIP